MVKVKVKEVFRDKNTKKVYKLDEIINVSEKRYKEIKEYVEIINEAKKKNNEVEN